MANPTTVPGDLIVPGSLRLSGALSPAKARANILALSELQPFVVPWTLWRTWDALSTNLPNSASNADDDLALVGGTWASASPSLQSFDCGALTNTSYARAQIPLPWEYEVGQTVALRLHAGMLTTIADASATLDLICFETDEELGISADICATAVKDVNSVTFADMDFTITPTALIAGDLLDVRLTVYVEDAGNAGAGITACIGSVKLLADVR